MHQQQGTGWGGNQTHALPPYGAGNGNNNKQSNNNNNQNFGGGGGHNHSLNPNGPNTPVHNNLNSHTSNFQQHNNGGGGGGGSGYNSYANSPNPNNSFNNIHNSNNNHIYGASPLPNNNNSNTNNNHPNGNNNFNGGSSLNPNAQHLHSNQNFANSPSHHNTGNLNFQSPHQFNHMGGNAGGGNQPYAPSPMVMSPQQSSGVHHPEVVGENALLGGSRDTYRSYSHQQQRLQQQQQQQHQKDGNSAFQNSPAPFRGGDNSTARVNGIPRSSVKDLFNGQVQGNVKENNNDGFQTPNHNNLGTPHSNFASANPLPSHVKETPGSIDPFYTQSEKLKNGLAVHEKPECSVTVYGFPPEGASFVLREFEQYGTITKKKIEQGGNWMHLQYSTKTEAEKALGKDGKILQRKLMIGVRRCIDTNFLELAVAPAMKQHVLNTPKEIRKPPRNLMQSTTTGTPTQNTPRKDGGFLSIAQDYLFGV